MLLSPGAANGEIHKRIEAHWANGADHVCIQPLRPDGEAGFDLNAIDAFALKA